LTTDYNEVEVLPPTDNYAARAGVGRPAGSQNMTKNKASARLAELGFDPIGEMVALHRQIEYDIANLMYDEDGEPREKYSQMAFATLVNAKQRVISDLLRYGYARIPEGGLNENKPAAKISITLSSSQPEFERLQAARSEYDENQPFKGADE
jgi:hypothetical protein